MRGEGEGEGERKGEGERRMCEKGRRRADILRNKQTDG